MGRRENTAVLLLLMLGAGLCQAGDATGLDEAVDLDAVYKADVMSNVSGGIKRGTDVLGNLDLKLTLDGERLFGWRGGNIFLHGISSLGGKPNADYAGTAQGIDSIEVETNTAKLYQAWTQQVMWNGRASVLAGLYDLNTEFYVNDTAGLFLHPAPGMGSEFAQSGLNGPSIFPTTSVAVRAKVQSTPDFYIQGAVLDGVPGDPNNPHGTHIQFNKGDGVLLVAEAGYLSGNHDQVFSTDRDRDNKTTEPFGKFVIGVWRYTSKFDDLVEVDGAGDPVRRNNNLGVYVLTEQNIYHEADDSSQGLAAFLSYGLANDDNNRFDHDLHVGAVYTGLIAGRDTDQLGFSLGIAHNGAKYRQSQAATGTTENETGLELTYRAHLTPWLAVQPSTQYIIHPNTDPQLRNATVIGVRFEVAMQH